MTPRVRWPRFALLFPAFAVLAVGALAGLVRIGWPSAPSTGAAVAAHGPLMVGGFYGTLIALERAVAVAKKWAYAGPALSAAGALAVAFGADVRAGALLMAISGALFVASSVLVVFRQAAAYTAMLLGGAASWFVASVLWFLGRPIPELVPWWIAFLALTIAGERLEMSRLTRIPAAARHAFAGAAALVLVSAGLSHVLPEVGIRLLGVSLLGLAAWVARFDVARRTFRTRGLTRYMAVSLFAAYAWLTVTALLALAAGRFVPGPLYDAAIHATFLGFGFSMVFGHAPVVFPAVLGVPIPYAPRLYLPLVLLHFSVALRVACDLAGAFELRRWAGLLNGVALLVFVVLVAAAVVRTLRTAGTRAPARVRDATAG